MTLRPPDETFVRSTADLVQLWRDLMGPGGFARRSLWMIFFEDDGRMSPVIVPIDDLPDEPDDRFPGNLAMILEQTVEPPARSTALLLSRPGPVAMVDSDRRWAQALRTALNSSVVLWPMYLATTGHVQVFTPDDLVAA